MIGNKAKILDWLKEQSDIQVFEIRKCRKKRYTDANLYAWHLINCIANVKKVSKEEVYLSMLEYYGQSIIVPVQQGLPINGIFKYYKLIDEKPINGQMASFYKLMKSSSLFDKKEMSIFIDGLIQEAKLLDIKTLMPDEIEQLKQAWE